MKGCRPLTDDEWTRLFEAVTGLNGLRTKALLILGVKTGFRVSELLSLRIKDLISDGKPVKRVTVLREHMKGGKIGRATSRTVLLHPATHDHILAQWRYLQKQGFWRPDSFFFQSRKSGNTPITRQAAWRDINMAVQAIPLEGRIGTHGPMRKTFARQKLDYLRNRWEPGKEIPVQTLQRITGHKSIDALMSYIEFADDDVEDAILNS